MPGYSAVGSGSSLVNKDPLPPKLYDCQIISLGSVLWAEATSIFLRTHALTSSGIAP